MVHDFFSWARDHVLLLTEWAGLSLVAWVVSMALTIVALRYYLIWIPPDYFASDHKPFAGWRDSHPVVRWALLVSKNVLGALLIVAGLIMLVTPGPGWLALLIGLALVDVPGKRTMERRIVERPAIFRIVNHMREKAGHPPLDLSDRHRSPA
jgi:hypothetical protein